MAFATSPSAFGIKPASSGGAFGAQSQQLPGQQPSQQPAAGGLFGSTQPNQGGFGAWGQTNSQQQNQQQNQQQPSTGFGSGSIFGNPSQLQSNQQPNTQQPSTGFGSGNIFGNPSQQQSSQQPNTQQQSTSFGSGSIFGNPSQQQSGQQPNTQQPSTGFGAGGSIFSNPGLQQNQQQPSTGFGTGGSIFGNLNNQQQNQQRPPIGFGTGSSIFGNPGGQQQPSQQGGGLWGSTTAPNAGQSTLGQPTSGANQQQAQPPFTRTTKFNDLSEQIQKTLESIDTHIQGRIQICSDLKARSLDEEPTRGAELIRKVHNDLVNTMSTLQADKAIAEELRSKVDQSVQDTIIATRIMDGFRNPQQNGAYLKNHANFPIEFFSRATNEIRQKLQWYKTTIEQIERRLASAQNTVQYNPQAITATLQAQNSTFIALAGKTAELDAELQRIKAVYRELWRTHTGSARDPFNEVDRRVEDGSGMMNGIGSLNLGR